MKTLGIFAIHNLVQLIILIAFTWLRAHTNSHRMTATTSRAIVMCMCLRVCVLNFLSCTETVFTFGLFWYALGYLLDNDDGVYFIDRKSSEVFFKAPAGYIHLFGIFATSQRISVCPWNLRLIALESWNNLILIRWLYVDLVQCDWDVTKKTRGEWKWRAQDTGARKLYENNLAQVILSLVWFVLHSHCSVYTAAHHFKWRGSLMAVSSWKLTL